MRLYLLLLISSISFSLSSFSQKNLTGYVFDKETNLPLSNATLSLKCSASITQTNESGYFILKSYCNKDTIQISMVGYKKLAINIDTFKGSIALTPDITQLSDVEVFTKKYKSKIELDSYSGIHFFTFSTSSPMILAQKIYNKKNGATLSTISLRKTADYSKFKIHVYDMDTSTKNPKTDLTDTGIVVESSNRNVVINIEPFNISLNQPAFFVGIEWISTSENYSYAFSKITNRNVVSDIHPILYMKLKKDKEELNEPSIFIKINKGRKWLPDQIGSERKFLLSATIKY